MELALGDGFHDGDIVHFDPVECIHRHRIEFVTGHAAGYSNFSLTALLS